MSSDKTIGEVIAEAREEKNLSQTVRFTRGQKHQQIITMMF